MSDTKKQIRCMKCGKYVQDGMIPLCDEHLMHRKQPKNPDHGMTHWEEGYEPDPAA